MTETDPAEAAASVAKRITVVVPGRGRESGLREVALNPGATVSHLLAALGLCADGATAPLGFATERRFAPDADLFPVLADGEAIAVFTIPWWLRRWPDGTRVYEGTYAIRDDCGSGKPRRCRVPGCILADPSGRTRGLFLHLVDPIAVRRHPNAPDLQCCGRGWYLLHVSDRCKDPAAAWHYGRAFLDHLVVCRRSTKGAADAPPR